MATETSIPVLKRPEESPGSSSTRGAPLTQDDDDFSALDLLDILIILKKRKRAIITATVTCAILATVIAFILPVRYTAKVTLLPPQQSSSMGAMLSSQLSSLGNMASLTGGGLGLKNPNDMYVAMLKGRTVEDAMIEHFDLAGEYHKRYISDARKTFERRATVDGGGKDGLIHISVEDRDPRRAAELANGYVDQLRALTEHIAITEASQRRLFFERQLLQAKNNLADSEESLKRTEQKTGVIQLDSQARALIESATSLRAAMAAKEVQIQGIQTYATGQNAQLVLAQQELQSLRAQLAKLGGLDENSDSSLIIPKGKVTEVGIEYVRKLRDVKYNETIFDILARQFEIAKLDEAKQGAVIQVVDAAVPPDKRSFPQRTLIILCGALAGLLGGVFFVFTQGHFTKLKTDPEIVERLSQLRNHD
jgi:tyrosine-protein kinase Etk/Wzc